MKEQILRQVDRSTLHISTRTVLDRVEEGEPILVSTRGHPIAVIVPLEEYERLARVRVRGRRWSPVLEE